MSRAQFYVSTIVSQKKKFRSFVSNLSLSLTLLLIITHLDYMVCGALLFGWTREGHAAERG